MGFRRSLAAATLVLTAAGCATTSQVRPVPVATESHPAPAAAPALAATPAPAAAPALATETPATPEPSKKEQAARERFAQAVAAFDAGDDAKAAEGFKDVLKLTPQSLNAQFNLGVIAERQGKPDEAIAAYEKVRFLEPGHVATLLNLGRLYRVQEKYAQAISLYETGLKAPGREHEASLLNNLTVAYRLAGKYEQAEASARRVLERHPEDTEAYKNLALVYYDQGRFRLAELVLANARKLSDKDPGLFNNLGMVYLKLEDRPRALAQFQKAVSLDEHFAPGYVNLGALALAWRDYAGAERSFAKAVELEPGSHEAWLYYAYALDGQKGRDPKKGTAAGEAFEKVLALRAETPEAICGAGWAYSVERTGWDKAEGFLQRCKSQPTASAQDKQLIDAKLQGLAALRKSGAPAAAPADPASSAAAVGGSGIAPAKDTTPTAAEDQGATSTAAQDTGKASTAAQEQGTAADGASAAQTPPAEGAEQK